MFLSLFLAITNKTNWGKRCKDYNKKALDGVMIENQNYNWVRTGWKVRGHSAKLKTTNVSLARVNFLK